MLFLSASCQGMPGSKQGKDDIHASESENLKFKEHIDTERHAGPNDAETEHHGVPMHGDDVRGKENDEHALPNIPEEQKIQEPKDPNEVMHESMHGQEGGSKHAWDEKTSEGKQGPPDIEQMMHGLMHNDDNVHKHAWDAEKTEGAQSPPDREHLMHNLMMHGDLEHGEHQEQTETQSVGKGEKLETVHSPPTHGKHHDTGDGVFMIKNDEL